MARWLALVPILVVAALAGAAAAPAPESRGARPPAQTIEPTLPWPAPTAAAADERADEHADECPDMRGSAAAVPGPLVAPPPMADEGAAAPAPPSAKSPPTSQAGAAKPLATREAPAVNVVGNRWYEEPQRDLSPVTARLYLDRMLSGEVVEGWSWDPGYKVEDAAPAFGEAPTDQRLSFGFEGRVERSSAKNESGDYIDAYMVGPSMNWQPSSRTQLEFAPLVGLAAPYPMSEVVVAFGWKF